MEFRPGETAEAVAAVDCLEELRGELWLVDDRGERVASAQVDGAGSYELAFTLREDEPRVGRLHAELEGERSNEVPFYIQDDIAPEQIEGLIDVAEDLADFTRALQPDDSDSQPPLEAVLERLQADPRVRAAEICSDCVMYLTEDGLVGSYGMGVSDEGVWGKTTRREAYDQGLEEHGDDVILSDLTLTNTGIVMLSPELAGEEFDEFRSASAAALGRLSQKIGGDGVETLQGEAVIRALGDGSYTDNGLVCFSTHGNVIERHDGSSMLYFQLGQLRPEQFESYVSGSENQNWGDMDSFVNRDIWDYFNGFFGGGRTSRRRTIASSTT